MKKLFFIAVIASVALVGCIKNDPAPSVNDQNEITFSTPVVALNTKTLVTGVLNGTKYPDSQTFNVWGWYCNSTAYSSTDAVAYMTDVMVAYDGEDYNDKETETGTWKATPTYYWPKNENARLTFDAYSPTELQGYSHEGYTSGTCEVSCAKVSGISIKNYIPSQVVSNQIDILYSTRSYDNTNSSYTSGNDYEGVDIQFNHALSAIEFKVSTDADYGANTIRLKAINIGAYCIGNFSQNIMDDKTSTPQWGIENKSALDGYSVFYADGYGSSLSMSTTPTKVGTTALLVPQGFDNDNQEIEIVYYIKNNDEEEIQQVTTFELCDDANQVGKDEEGKDVTVFSWLPGKRYTYNIIFGLDEIYFAPAVSDWDDVTVALPQI